MNTQSQDNPTQLSEQDHKRSSEQFQMAPYYREFVDYIFLSEQEIDNRLQKLSEAIVDHYGERPFVVIIVMKGAIMFFNKLRDHITKSYQNKNIKNCVVDEYIRVKSYHNTESRGKIDFDYSSIELETLKDKEVLIIDDINDTGRTLQSIRDKISTFQPKDIQICILLEIVEKHKFDVYCKFVAFQLPSFFYIGFGLDYNEYFRDFPHIGILNSKGIKQFEI